MLVDFPQTGHRQQIPKPAPHIMTTELVGVADARPSSHLVPITARLVEGMLTSLPLRLLDKFASVRLAMIKALELICAF